MLQPRYYYVVVGYREPSCVISRTAWYWNESFYLPKTSHACMLWFARQLLKQCVGHFTAALPSQPLPPSPPIRPTLHDVDYSVWSLWGIRLLYSISSLRRIMQCSCV